MQEVFRVIQVVARIGKRLADCVLESRCSNGRNLGDNPMRKNIPVPRVIDIGRVVIERGHRTDDARHHRHSGVGIVIEAFEQPQHGLVEHRMRAYFPIEFFELFRGREFAVQQQVADFDEQSFSRRADQPDSRGT